MIEMECLIKGRVTGVMFRDFVSRRARRLGLFGTVENVARGQVRVVAQGERTQLEQLVSCLKRGSILSRVDSVEVVERPIETPRFTDFHILH